MQYGLIAEKELPLTCTTMNTVGHLECAMLCAIKSSYGCEASEIRRELECCLFSSDKMARKENGVSSLIKCGEINYAFLMLQYYLFSDIMDMLK